MLGVRAFHLSANTHPDQGLLAIRVLSEKEPSTTFNQPFGEDLLSQAPPNVKSFKCFLEQQEVLTRGSFCHVISFIVELSWKLASEESGLIQIKGHLINHSELVPTMPLVLSVLDI